MPELQSAGRQRFDLLNRIIAIVLLGCCAAAQLPGPEHTVEKNVIVSEHLVERARTRIQIEEAANRDHTGSSEPINS